MDTNNMAPMAQMQPGAAPMGQPQMNMMSQGAQQPMQGPGPMQPPGMGDYDPTGTPDVDTSENAKFEDYIDYAISQSNLAKRFKNKTDKDGKNILEEMGNAVVKGYEDDEKSRENWMTRNKEWLKMAMLLRENKTWPWPKASNVKYPLVATAAMQFSARAYPALVPSDGQIVNTKIVQKNPQDQLYEAAQRVSAHMSYQVLNCIPNWEEDMDKLLMTMAVSGIAFKKTYHHDADECHNSSLVYPENFCINYHAKSIEKAYRKTEIVWYNDNEIKEKQLNNEEFLNVDLPQPTNNNDENKLPVVAGLVAPPVDKSTPHKFLIQHTFWDLDGDGYEEPYVITVHYKSKKVMRVIARWDQDGVKRNEDGDIFKIEPVEYYTAFPFIPNPDGSIYGLGFGLLLGPLNESVNTLINLNVDAGVLSNMQSGFIGKGLRLKMGEMALRPGEWRLVNATGDDLSKNIFPMPVREPSGVLFNLLQMLIQSGNQLASIAEIFVGKMPGQNTPATTTQETIQQGMAVFTAIYKRVYRSLTSEFKKLYRLNKITPDIAEEEGKIAGIQLQESDYSLPEWCIIPGADPTGDSSTVKMSKLQQVGNLLQLGTISPVEYTKRVLDANEIPNAQQLINPPQPPQPDPKMQTEQAKQQTEQIKQQGMQQKQQLEAQTTQQKLDAAERMAAIEATMKANEVSHQQQMQALQLQGERQSKQMDMVMQAIQNHFQAQQGNMDIAQAQAKHEATMAQSAQAFQQKQNQQAQTAKKRGRPKKGN